MVPGPPPADPEEWDDEQWLAWLEATDVEASSDDPEASGPPPVPAARRGAGHVLGQAMLGMAHAIYGDEDDQIVVVAQDGGEPEDDEPFTVRLDPDHPERSSVVFRAHPEPPS